ncbi:MAG: imidazolonepropionase [Myxococcota bacterium]|jgi:imidazolonepropionase
MTDTLLLTGIGRLVTMAANQTVADGTRLDVELIARDGRIAWIGPAGQGRAQIQAEEIFEALDCGGRAVLPGMVDAHTHLVFGGDRAAEFALRSSGVSYETISEQGGGIRSTVRATRAADPEALVEAARPRLDTMLSRGVTTVEIKSGYGLDVETELKMLRVARRLGETHAMNVVTTFLGAHTIPPEFAGNADGYVDLVVNEMIPAVAEEGLATFCDVFCETVAFSVAQTRRVLEAGIAHGLIPKLHSEQLHRTGGTALGAELGAASVDHLEFANEADIRALADSGQTTAVLLPGATLYLGLNDWAPARALLDAGVTVALSTDCNPGSCMCDDLPLMTTLACTRLGMSPHEALRAVTSGGAAALNLEAERGRAEEGLIADLQVLDCKDEVQLPYRFGRIPPYAVIAQGKIVIG